MSREKHQAHAEHEGNGERWLLTYADMITLLLIFFIILYAMGKTNQVKFDQLVQVLNKAFGGNKSVITMFNMGILRKNPPLPKGNTSEKEMYVKAAKEFQTEIENKQLSITQDERGTVVRMAADFFFTSGSADLTASALDVLKKVLGMLKDVNNKILVEGHTDNVPINPRSNLYQRFPTNWELSSQRAINVLKYFESSGIDRKRLAAVGFADTREIKENTSEENKKFNRRVEIILLSE